MHMVCGKPPFLLSDLPTEMKFHVAKTLALEVWMALQDTSFYAMEKVASGTNYHGVRGYLLYALLSFN